jgi:hypothetical protein
VNQFDEAQWFGCSSQCDREDGDLQVLAHLILKGRYADVG